jgi:hypothetical protein
VLTALIGKGKSLLRAGGTPSFGFPAAARQYGLRLRDDWSRLEEPEVKFDRRIGVVVCPWLCTTAPFFMLEVALQLRLAGYSVAILWDSGNVFVDAANPCEVAIIEPVLAMLPDWMEMLDVQSFPGTKEESFEFIDELVYENAVRHLRGENGAQEFVEEHPGWRRAMIEQAARMKGFLSSGGLHSICIPGGVWAGSGVWRCLCESLGIAYTTFDSGPGQLFVARDSAAAHFGDIRPCLKDILGSGEDTGLLVDLARQALQTRVSGRDRFALQNVPRSQNTDKFDVLVPLNLRFDSAALCRKRLFSSVTEWLNTLLTRLSARENLTIAIRQHPCERLEAFKGRDAWEEILAPFLFPGGSVRFFPAEASVNTYDLIENAKVVLPFTSRAGIEAAMMGKPVVTSANCYYDHCGFTVTPENCEDYFEAIDQSLAGEHVPDEGARLSAAVAFYLMEFCAVLNTPFTPQPHDFPAWMDIVPADLGEMAQVRNFIAVIGGTSRLPLLLHRQRFPRTNA